MVLRRLIASVAIAAPLLASGCRPTIPEPPLDQQIQVAQGGERVRVAVIGDYGEAGPAAAAVAAMVTDWDPDLVITLGDNNYERGASETIDRNVGQYYHHFISPYDGQYGEGAEINRFFPALGNHDWRTWSLRPYLRYFTLPGNERYYDLVWGPVHFFALDSDPAEPHGRRRDSRQARWLQDEMAASELPWQLVYMHHAPYSSGRHGSEKAMRWPYFQWGADLVLSGHDHHYERIERGDELYFVNGLGGNPTIYGMGSPIDGSVVQFNDDWGAMLIDATATQMDIRFVTIGGEVIDRVALTADRDPTEY